MTVVIVLAFFPAAVTGWVFAVPPAPDAIARVVAVGAVVEADQIRSEAVDAVGAIAAPVLLGAHVIRRGRTQRRRERLID